MNKNPIFKEYYSHEGCECYKVKNPWTKYAEEKIVLCPVSEGEEVARALAKSVLADKLANALQEPFAPNNTPAEPSRTNDAQ